MRNGYTVRGFKTCEIMALHNAGKTLADGVTRDINKLPRYKMAGDNFRTCLRVNWVKACLFCRKLWSVIDVIFKTGWRWFRFNRQQVIDPAEYVCQIKMPSWTKGRVALVGDAAYCTSPAAGMGGSLAIDGAAALADAFKRMR